MGIFIFYWTAKVGKQKGKIQSEGKRRISKKRGGNKG